MAKILLVEDNEMNRDMLSRRLLRRGYEVLVAEDGAAGVAMARSETPASTISPPFICTSFQQRSRRARNIDPN